MILELSIVGNIGCIANASPRLGVSLSLVFPQSLLALLFAATSAAERSVLSCPSEAATPLFSPRCQFIGVVTIPSFPFNCFPSRSPFPRLSLVVCFRRWLQSLRSNLHGRIQQFPRHFPRISISTSFNTVLPFQISISRTTDILPFLSVRNLQTIPLP